MSELAYTMSGDTFEVPSTVTAWRVRRLKPRGAPELVYSRDGRPLTVPIEADLDDLHEAVTASGKYRLDGIGDDGKVVENVPPAYIQVTKAERNAAGDHAIERTSDARVDSTMAGLGQAVIEAVRLNAEALRQNAEISMRAVDRLPQLMEAMTTMLNVATGTGLYALQQRDVPPPALRNAANDNGDEDDEDEDEDDDDEGGVRAQGAPTMFGGFPMPPGFDINKIVSQVASDVVSKLMDRFSGKLPSLGSVLDMRKAYADGQREREAQAQVTVVEAVATQPVASAPRVQPSVPSLARAPVAVPTDAVSMAHFLAVRNALSRDEQTLVVALANELTEAEQAAWFNELRALSVADAAATVRATLTQLQTRRQPAASLMRPPTSSSSTTVPGSPPREATTTGQPPK